MVELRADAVQREANHTGRSFQESVSSFRHISFSHMLCGADYDGWYIREPF